MPGPAAVPGSSGRAAARRVAPVLGILRPMVRSAWPGAAGARAARPAPRGRPGPGGPAAGRVSGEGWHWDGPVPRASRPGGSGRRCILGFALVVGYAVQAHGFLDRPSADVDLFAEASTQFDFSQAADAVIAAYRRDGLQAEAEARSSTFARLSVSSGEERAKVD